MPDARVRAGRSTLRGPVSAPAITSSRPPTQSRIDAAVRHHPLRAILRRLVLPHAGHHRLEAGGRPVLAVRRQHRHERAPACANLSRMSTADVAVVGAGIVGMAVARELALREPRRRVVVLEREDRVGTHQTGRNSGVVHAGIYYTPGSLKARLCVAGMRELAAYCEARGLAYERCAKLIVALEPGELPALDELERRGKANGVPGLRRVDAAGL